MQSGALSPVDLVRGLPGADRRPARAQRLHHAARRTGARRRRTARAQRFAPGATAGRCTASHVSVKDLIDVAGVKTTSGSALPRDRRATRTRRPSRSSAQPARSSSARPTCTSSRSARPARNRPSDRCAIRSTRRDRPADRAAAPPPRSPTGMCFGALGTDTGGSIRIPSAACGTVGLKATIGELSCEGVVPLSTSLDHLGPMARSVADVALLFDVLHGPAARATSQRSDGTRSSSAFRAPYFCDRVEPGVAAGARAGVRSAARRRAIRSGTSRSITPPWTPDVYLHIVLPEASRYHARFARAIRRPLFTGRARAAGDGPLSPRGRLRARDASAADAHAARSIARSTAATRCCCRRCRFRRRRSAPRRSTSTARPNPSAPRCCG